MLNPAPPGADRSYVSIGGTAGRIVGRVVMLSALAAGAMPAAPVQSAAGAVVAMQAGTAPSGRTDAADRTVAPDPPSDAPDVLTAGSVARAERGLVRCANRARRSRGIPSMRTDRTLGRAARNHARDMRRHGFFDHAGPDGRGPWERVHDLPGGDRFSGVGENIAAGYPSHAQTCRAWMGSPKHRRNMLDARFTSVGGGFALGTGTYGTYFVQVFGTTDQ